MWQTAWRTTVSAGTCHSVSQRERAGGTDPCVLGPVLRLKFITARFLAGFHSDAIAHAPLFTFHGTPNVKKSSPPSWTSRNRSSRMCWRCVKPVTQPRCSHRSMTLRLTTNVACTCHIHRSRLDALTWAVRSAAGASMRLTALSPLPRARSFAPSIRSATSLSSELMVTWRPRPVRACNKLVAWTDSVDSRESTAKLTWRRKTTASPACAGLRHAMMWSRKTSTGTRPLAFLVGKCLVQELPRTLLQIQATLPRCHTRTVRTTVLETATEVPEIKDGETAKFRGWYLGHGTHGIMQMSCCSFAAHRSQTQPALSLT